ncbi:MAG: efflux RND transporter periplasmic adaptor subunit, partial [Verrucomicrobia bacterium]
MKKWIVLFLLAAAAGGAWWWLQRGNTDAPEYQTTTVASGPMTQIVTASGAL